MLFIRLLFFFPTQLETVLIASLPSRSAASRFVENIIWFVHSAIVINDRVFVAIRRSVVDSQSILIDADKRNDTHGFE